MNKKELMENLEDLAKEAGEHQDSLELAACLRVLVMGAKKQDTFLLKFMQVYSHLNYSDKDSELWAKLSHKAERSKDRNIALQIRGFLVNVLGMSPKDPDFSYIKKEVMSDPPRYDLFFALLNRDGLPTEPIKIFQIREIVERHMSSRNLPGQQ